MKMSEYPITQGFKSAISVYVHNSKIWQKEIDKLIADDMTRLEFEQRHELFTNALNREFDSLLFEYQKLKSTNQGNKKFHAYVKRLFTEAVKKA